MKSLIYVFCILISVFNTNAQKVGIGTSTPSGKLQIEHRGTLSSPTLSLIDSATNAGPTITFRNMGGSRYWMIRGTLNNSVSNDDYLDFMNNGTILATLGSTGNFGIGVFTAEEKLDVAGTVKFSGELNRSSTGTSNMVPVAYGNMASSGGVNSGSGNFFVTRPSTGRYEISISGELYHYQTYTSVVTPVGSLPVIVSTASISGRLLVFIYNTAGVAVDSQFCFVVYKQ